MSQTNKQISISTTMSHALRHEPQKYELEVDEYGFINIDLFLNGLKKHGGKRCRDITMEQIVDIVNTDTKGRYEIKDNNIRALGGHNKKIGKKIIKTLAIPLDIMYHGTTHDSAITILTDGLKGMERQNANLSIDIETAKTVGRRRSDNPIILVADCKKAYEDGIEFFIESNGIYSVEYLPSKYFIK